jgi:integrase
MATYKARGVSHSIIYWCETPEGKKQQWETYVTELEALQRKAYIDYLQKNKMDELLYKAAIEYKNKRAAEKAARETLQDEAPIVSMPYVPTPAGEDNTDKTYREFAEKWLPFQARKNRFSPNTYDSYEYNLRNHILPYFGERVMSTITSEDVDNFIDHLSRKPCMGSKSYHKSPEDVPTLASGSVKKCYNIITSGFLVAKKWRYITAIPETTAPAEKWKKRNAWDSERVYSAFTDIKDDKLLHLAVHIAFVCSLRAGETAGIDIATINFQDSSLWITQTVQRVSDRSLAELPQSEIIRVFPKQVPSSKSSMILKGPKTEGSYRKQYLTAPLMLEIKERLNVIERYKRFYEEEYNDYGLLFCQPDGRPIDPCHFNKWFKDWQKTAGIKDQIEFQGLRKSGQMHKVRLTQNNYQLVAENSGQSPEVLMSNYNEALDSEKRALSMLVETNFYPQEIATSAQPDKEMAAILRILQSNPEMTGRILQTLFAGASHAQQDKSLKC